MSNVLGGGLTINLTATGMTRQWRKIAGGTSTRGNGGSSQWSSAARSTEVDSGNLVSGGIDSQGTVTCGCPTSKH